MRQYVITPASGKRLIGKGMVAHPAVVAALESGTIVIVGGTTNGYVAEEVLEHIGQAQGFDRKRFFRGITLPPPQPGTEGPRRPDPGEFPGDVIIINGAWVKGKTLFDVVDDLKEGDVILKGANALDLSRRRCAILVGDPKAGTIGVAVQAVAGRRVQLILPVGLEKRVPGDLDTLAEKINAPGERGARLLPVPGKAFTEIDAVAQLTGAEAELIAGGGVCGAEGSYWLGVSGTDEEVEAANKLLKSVASEPAFAL